MRKQNKIIHTRIGLLPNAGLSGAWTQGNYLKLISIEFTDMDEKYMETSPITTIAVERKRNYKSDAVSIKQIIVQIYKLDKVISITYIQI